MRTDGGGGSPVGVKVRFGYDRAGQLRAFAAGLQDLLAFLRAYDVYTGEIEALEANLAECRRLLGGPFTQADLTGLSLRFAPFIDTFREWTPPLEPDGEGGHVVPAWFGALEALHRRAAAAAFALRVVGEY